MSDISLNLNAANIGTDAYRDLLIANNDLVLTSDVNPDGTDPVLQDIVQRIRFFLGEWFLDNTQGVPWLQEILVKGFDQGAADSYIQETILGTLGVQALLTYGSRFDAGRRKLTLQFSVKTQNGTVSYTDTVVPTQGSNS